MARTEAGLPSKKAGAAEGERRPLRRVDRRPRRRGALRDEITDEAELARLVSVRDALRAAARGDFSVRLPAEDGSGVVSEIAAAFNALIGRNEALVTELFRMEQAVGIEGKTSERINLGPTSGSWTVASSSVNALVEKLAWPLSEATSLFASLAEGDLSHEMPLHVNGAPLRGDLRVLGMAAHGAVNKLRAVSTRVSRVVREIGMEGRSAGKRASRRCRGPGRSSSTTSTCSPTR